MLASPRVSVCRRSHRGLLWRFDVLWSIAGHDRDARSFFIFYFYYFKIFFLLIIFYLTSIWYKRGSPKNEENGEQSVPYPAVCGTKLESINNIQTLTMRNTRTNKNVYIEYNFIWHQQCNTKRTCRTRSVNTSTKRVSDKTYFGTNFSCHFINVIV